MNNSVNIVINHFNLIGGFQHFHATLFAMLPLTDRIEILSEEFILRPTTKTIDKLILAYAKSGDRENTLKYINIGIEEGLLDEYVSESDHYTSWLTSGPTKIITPTSAYQDIKGMQGKGEYEVSQVDILLAYLENNYLELEQSKSSDNDLTEEEKKRILLQCILEVYSPTNSQRIQEAQVKKEIDEIGNDLQALLSEVDKRTSWYIYPINIQYGNKPNLLESRIISEKRIYMLLDKIESIDSEYAGKCLKVRERFEELKRFEENNPHPDNQASKLRMQGLLSDDDMRMFQNSGDRYMAVQRYHETKEEFEKRLIKAVKNLIGEGGNSTAIIFILIVVFILFLLFL